MTRPKINEGRVQDLLDVVRYTLDFHEWCEQIAHVDPVCGKTHYVYCWDIGSEEKCDGCKAREKAVRALSGVPG